jgi:hypothetical protein
VEEIEKYCRDDVALLRDLMAHAERHGHLCFRTRNGERVRLPAPWRIPELLEEIRARQGETARTRPDRRSPAAPARPG